MSRVGWLDCSTGVSGDMLLGALDGVGALAGLPDLLSSLAALGVSVSTGPTSRHGIAATALRIEAPGEQPHRGLQEVLAVIDRAAATDTAKERARNVFGHLASVEGAVHGQRPDDVHFHEVGAVDSIVDVLAGCLGLDQLGLDALVVSPIALGGGTARSAHGTLAVPTPAALGLLAGSDLVGYGGPLDVELATPTGLALLREWATGTGPMPAMRVQATGVGAGGRELADRANVVRLVVGDAAEPAAIATTAATAAADPDGQWHVIAANVDDLDPRLWPGVLDQLLAAGAADAWLTPILMKKGRPAHTVSALAGPEAVAPVRHVLLSETSTIGVRMTAVDKHALARSWITVDVGGQQVRVKLAHDGERRMNLAPEFVDVSAAAVALGVPAKDVLARATAAALHDLGD